MVNVWDAITAKTVADVPGTKALATASHSIAATLGYPDGEKIPVEEMVDMCRRIVEATDLPVSADLEVGTATPRTRSAARSASAWWVPTSRTR